MAIKKKVKGPNTIKLLFKSAFFKNKTDLYLLFYDKFISCGFREDDKYEKIIIDEKDSIK